MESKKVTICMYCKRENKEAAKEIGHLNNKVKELMKHVKKLETVTAAPFQHMSNAANNNHSSKPTKCTATPVQKEKKLNLQEKMNQPETFHSGKQNTNELRLDNHNSSKHIERQIDKTHAQNETSKTVKKKKSKKSSRSQIAHQCNETNSKLGQKVAKHQQASLSILETPKEVKSINSLQTELSSKNSQGKLAVNFQLGGNSLSKTKKEKKYEKLAVEKPETSCVNTSCRVCNSDFDDIDCNAYNSQKLSFSECSSDNYEGDFWFDFLFTSDDEEFNVTDQHWPKLDHQTASPAKKKKHVKSKSTTFPTKSSQRERISSFCTTSGYTDSVSSFELWDFESVFFDDLNYRESTLPVTYSPPKEHAVPSYINKRVRHKKRIPINHGTFRQT